MNDLIINNGTLKLVMSDILYRIILWLKYGKSCHNTRYLATSFLLETNSILNKISRYECNSIECYESLISYLPEIKDNFDKLYKIDKDNKNGWSGQNSSDILQSIENKLDSIKINKRIKLEENSNPSFDIILEKVKEWYKNGDIGLSSSSICLACLLQNKSFLNYKPHDEYDMNRCILLVQNIPEMKHLIDEFLNNSNNISEKWKNILKDVRNENNVFLDISTPYD